MRKSALLRVALAVILNLATLPFLGVQNANAASASSVGPSNNSLEFASASSYLSMSPGVNFGTSAFTFETYFKTGSVIDNGFFLGVGSGNGVSINIHSANEIQIDAYGINATVFVLASSMQTNTWYHLAVARDASSNETVWLDGVRAASAYNRWNTSLTYGPVFVDTRNYNGAATGINQSTACGHCNGPGDRDFTGVRMTNFRVVVGSTVYDPTSATITPPTTPLANVSNTKLLLNVSDQSGATTDSSGTQTISNTSVTFVQSEIQGAGTSWTQSTFPNSKTAFSILYANNLFVAAPWDQSATYLLTSTDGITWTERSIPVAGGWESMAYGNGIYVAVGDVGGGSAQNKYIYSSDGVTWSASNTVSSGAARDVAFGNGIFVATQGGGCSGTCIRTSTDGVTWTQRSTPVSGNFRSVVHTGSAFYAVSNASTAITSTDGISWTSTSAIGSSVEELAFGNSKFVTVSTSGVIRSSTDFSSWSQGSGYSASKNWQHVFYANDKFVAIEVDGTINVSSDGNSWRSVTSNLASGGFFAYGANKFIALSSSGNSFAYSNSSSIPTFAWSNVTKTIGDAAFTLTSPVPSIPGTFTYSSGTPGVISLDNVNTSNATIVAGGTSVITASFTPTDAVTYASGTTTMTVTVNKASQAALSLSLNATRKNFPYSQALTLSTSGGTGSGAVTYAIASGGTASSCSLANNSSSNTISAASGGTCLVQATKASDSSYLSVTSSTQTFTFNAPVSITYAPGDLGTGTVPTLSGSYFSGESITVANGSSLSRAGFKFNGWKNSSNNLVSADSALVLSTNDTLTAQWRQVSLFGLSDSEITELQSWNASTNSNSGTVSNSVSSFTVSVPGSALPNGTTVKLWEISNSNLARSKVGSDKEYIVNLVVSWLKTDGTVPTANVPITLSISNSSIKKGAIAYQIIGESVTQIGTAASDGLLALSITEDPIITVANPAVSSGSSGGGGGGGGAPSSTVETPIPLEIAKPPSQSASNSVTKTIQHQVTFGSNAAWVNSKNIKDLKAFILEASTNIIVEKIVIKGFATPSKYQLNNLDVARAKAVAKLLKQQGIKYPVVLDNQGITENKKVNAGRSAIVTVLGRPKEPNE
jgi:uncharacterized repeat protein (TIGR02543 family)